MNSISMISKRQIGAEWAPLVSTASGAKVCDRVSEPGSSQSDAVRDNWGRNQVSHAEVVKHPSSVAELRRFVIDAIRAGQTPCVVRGSMHSWSTIAVQKSGTAIDLSRMAGEVKIDREAGTASVSGSMMLGDLYEHLASAGLALAYIPTVEGVTVAGAAATDTHGADRVSGHFVDQIREMRLIDGLGRNIAINGEGCWALKEDGSRSLLIGGLEPLQHGRRHLGLLGAVYEMTLDCVPAYDLEMRQRPMGEEEAFGTNYEKLAVFLGAHAHADLFYFPNNGKVLLRDADVVPPGTKRHPRGWFGETVVDGLLRSDLASMALVAATKLPLLTGPLSWLASNTFGDLMIRDRSDRVSTYLPGHVKRYVSFQTMEYGVPVAEAGAALDIIKDVTSKKTLPLPLYMRRVGDTFFFELIWPKGFPGGEETARNLETRVIAAFGDRAMPHEGKLFFTNPWTRTPETRRDGLMAIKRKLDPGGVFTSSYMRGYLAGAPPETCTACDG